MPWPEQRGNKWRVRWDTGTLHPETGRKIYDSKSGFDTKAEAYAYGLDREADVRNDRYISRRDGSVLMKDYCKTWPDTLDVGHLRERNVRSYIRLYIEPRWGETSVGDIRPSMYRAWEKWLKAQPNVGSRYAGEILRVFSMMMDDAVADGLRQASPVQRQTRRGRYVKKPREKKRHMEITDVFQLAQNALIFWGMPGFTFVLTMAFTGMRPAELYALRREYVPPAWPSADPDEEQRDEAVERYAGDRPMPAIRVQWQHQRVEGELSLLPPKYESHRSLVVPPFLAELLELTLASHGEPWVFPAIKGGPLANANFSYHYWRPIADGRDARATGKPQWRWLPAWPAVRAYAGKRLYLLRHGHKEWLDDDGHPRVAVEARMGHELPGVEGVYSNVTPSMERAIMESLQLRWVGLMRSLEPGFRLPSPKPLPVDLQNWLEQQVKAARNATRSTGS